MQERVIPSSSSGERDSRGLHELGGRGVGGGNSMASSPGGHLLNLRRDLQCGEHATMQEA